MAKTFDFEYQSPINIDYIFETIDEKIKDGVIKSVASYGIKVDYEELIKALTYDRDMWHKGFEAGYMMGKEEALEGKKYIDFEKMNNITEGENESTHES